MVVLSYRTQREGDTLVEYYRILGSPLEVKDLKGRKGKSKPSYTKYKKISGHDWVDSQHRSSELPGFITRYLATVKNGRSLLVTVTVHKDKYGVYMPELYKMIESIKIRMTLPYSSTETGVSGLLGQKLASFKVKKKKEEKKLPLMAEAKKEKDNTMAFVIGIGLFAAIVAYIILKKRRKRKPKKKSMIS
jgi:LPXTG-motif cell wall-anchored protein